MAQKSDLRKLLESGDEPRGVTVQAADGRLFFLTEAEAMRTSIPKNKLYHAYRLMRGASPGPRNPKKRSLCDWAADWLDSHSPNSARWRRICLTYYDSCL